MEKKTHLMNKLPGPEQPQHPTPLPLFEQVINRLNYLTLDYTELTNYAYAMTSRIADTTRLCNEDEKNMTQMVLLFLI